jgi:hypothetical protein
MYEGRIPATASEPLPRFWRVAIRQQLFCWQLGSCVVLSSMYLLPQGFPAPQMLVKVVFAVPKCHSRPSAR